MCVVCKFKCVRVSEHPVCLCVCVRACVCVCVRASVCARIRNTVYTLTPYLLTSLNLYSD